MTMPLIRITIAALLCPIVLYFYTDISSADNMRSIASTFAAVSGTLLGFIIAALSILTAMINRRLVSNLRKTGHYDQLLHDFFITAGGYLATMTVSLVTLFLNDSIAMYGLYLSSFVMVWATLCFVVTGRKFALMLKYLV
jgi:hypothetical protein